MNTPVYLKPSILELSKILTLDKFDNMNLII